MVSVVRIRVENAVMNRYDDDLYCWNNDDNDDINESNVMIITKKKKKSMTVIFE